MSTTQTLARLKDLKLGGMAAALEHQQNQPGTYDDLPFAERLELLLDREFQTREHRKQDRLVRQARFKLRASVRRHPRAFRTADPAGLLLRLRAPSSNLARCGAVLRRSLPIYSASPPASQRRIRTRCGAARAG